MKRRISATEKIPQVLHIETAIFIDKDLYKHMAINFGNDTEQQLIRFILALVNGVRIYKQLSTLATTMLKLIHFRFNFYIIIRRWGIKLILYSKD